MTDDPRRSTAVRFVGYWGAHLLDLEQSAVEGCLKAVEPVGYPLQQDQRRDDHGEREQAREEMMNCGMDSPCSLARPQVGGPVVRYSP